MSKPLPSLAEDDLMTVPEVARWLRISPAALYDRLRRANLAGTQTVPYLHLGRSIRFRRSDVRAWLISQSKGQLALELHPGDDIPREMGDR